MNIKHPTLLFSIILFASSCTKQQIKIEDDNITGYTTNDIIVYLENYQQKLTSDSVAEVIKVKQAYINDIQGWVEEMERVDSSFNKEDQDTTAIDISAKVPLLDSVLTQAIDYLNSDRGSDYLSLMEDNWENFTIFGPMANSQQCLDLLMIAYAPFYWASYATLQNDTVAFYKAVLNKLDLIHYQSRMASLMHNPPTPYNSYFQTTQLGMLCNMQMDKYKEALEYGDGYLTDLFNWQFISYEDLYEYETLNIHLDILDRMQYCYLNIGEDSTVILLDKLKSIYIQE